MGDHAEGVKEVIPGKEDTGHDGALVAVMAREFFFCFEYTIYYFDPKGDGEA